MTPHKYSGSHNHLWLFSSSQTPHPVHQEKPLNSTQGCSQDMTIPQSSLLPPSSERPPFLTSQLSCCRKLFTVLVAFDLDPLWFSPPPEQPNKTCPPQLLPWVPKPLRTKAKVPAVMETHVASHPLPSHSLFSHLLGSLPGIQFQVHGQQPSSLL